MTADSKFSFWTARDLSMLQLSHSFQQLVEEAKIKGS